MGINLTAGQMAQRAYLEVTILLVVTNDYGDGPSIWEFSATPCTTPSSW